MTRTLHAEADYPVSPDIMLKIMTDHKLLDHRHRLQGALEVRVSERRPGNSRLIQEVTVDEYWRNLHGQDRTRVESAATVYDWDLEKHTCNWKYRGPRKVLVQIEGHIRIESHQGGCKVLSNISVRVPVPIFGSMLENRIAHEIEDGFKPLDDLLHAFCRAEN